MFCQPKRYYEHYKCPIFRTCPPRKPRIIVGHPVVPVVPVIYGNFTTHTPTPTPDPYTSTPTPGLYTSTPTIRPILCKPGYYLNESTCTECEPGYYCNNNIKKECGAGSYCRDKIRIPCPSGKTYRDNPTAQAESECIRVCGEDPNGPKSNPIGSVPNQINTMCVCPFGYGVVNIPLPNNSSGYSCENTGGGIRVPIR